jgi:hypothetical protein
VGPPLLDERIDLLEDAGRFSMAPQEHQGFRPFDGGQRQIEGQALRGVVLGQPVQQALRLRQIRPSSRRRRPWVAGSGKASLGRGPEGLLGPGKVAGPAFQIAVAEPARLRTRRPKL